MMKIVVTAVSVITLTGSALAGEIEGVVSNYDPATRMIVLESGEAYRLTDGVQLDGLEPGGTVVVTYNDGTTDATSVAVSQ
ncbi:MULTISPECIES: DUF1344 domain-containing protein [unclassified Hoeflea]|jgi:hypothetical protein|uniref:DUF1344 domain-containing protein n=1 Tax=unclassified Hoeflea TaxID=2614931 RepID=UPI002AFF1815|nr:DUF1344 domain-containing protein [Hoeflea sp.]